jgi:predicted lipoprotein with Yx(FWY)xxD motif
MKNLFIALVVSLVSVGAMAQGRFAPLAEMTIADGRTIVTTAEGMAIYTFDVDQPGVSNCYNGCAKAWPPVLVQSAAGLQAPMGVTQRKDGTLQLTIDNQPVYLFQGDQNPGDIEGDNLNNVWHIIVL